MAGVVVVGNARGPGAVLADAARGRSFFSSS
jgi:hypothetical protein